MLAGLLIVAGAAGSAFGVFLVLTRPRPASLLGMLLAPAGVMLVLWGVARALAR